MATRKEKIMTVRLDGLRQERLDQLAAWLKAAPSEILRQAIDHYFIEQNSLRAKTAYERLKPWIGIIDSRKTGRGPFTTRGASAQVREMIVEKWEKRRAKRAR